MTRVPFLTDSTHEISWRIRAKVCEGVYWIWLIREETSENSKNCSPPNELSIESANDLKLLSALSICLWASSESSIALSEDLVWVKSLRMAVKLACLFAKSSFEKSSEVSNKPSMVILRAF